MKLSQRERYLLYATILVGVILVSWLLLLPLVRSCRSLGDQRLALQQQLEQYEATVARKPLWQQEYEALRGNLGERTEQYEQMSEVLQKIEEVAKASGVNLTTRSGLSPKDRGVFVEFPASCRLEATTESLVRFLFALRTGSGFVSVQKLDITAQPKSNVLTCDIEIRALAGKSKRTSP